VASSGIMVRSHKPQELNPEWKKRQMSLFDFFIFLSIGKFKKETHFYSDEDMNKQPS
jgi:hypothetical protein